MRTKSNMYIHPFFLQSLARRLGVRQLPEIVAFVNGEAVSMKVSRYDVRSIVDFASDALTTVSSSSSTSSRIDSSSFPPFADVRVLESSSAFDSFVSGWHGDNLVRTLFIGPRTTLRFSVPCFAMRKRHLCAFVHSSQPWILDKGWPEGKVRKRNCGMRLRVLRVRFCLICLCVWFCVSVSLRVRMLL